jgi:hypothetical protein
MEIRRRGILGMVSGTMQMDADAGRGNGSGPAGAGEQRVDSDQHQGLVSPRLRNSNVIHLAH